MYIQHNTTIADGLSGLSEALAVSEGTFGNNHTSYYDLWRVEDGYIAEHWDVMEIILPKDAWQNENGKF